MIIQLIYWASLLKCSGPQPTAASKHPEHSLEEREAFLRSLAKHRGRQFIRYA